MKPDRWLSLVAVVGLALPACAGPGDRAPSPAAQGGSPSTGAFTPVPATLDGLPVGVDTTVERIVDGDTLVIAGGRRIRLIGVDTPETKDPRRPVQCFGREAAAFLASTVAPGTTIRLVGDVEQLDPYGRTLAYLYRLPDGLFVNAELLRQGFAQVLTIPPNVTHADRFVALAGEARAAGRGLWSACGDPP